ncbi:MAG: hypothetical protein SOY65_08445 [Marinifilaceae bacterium]|nr:hypothetical protein [Marinifilaceae bacterium]
MDEMAARCPPPCRAKWLNAAVISRVKPVTFVQVVRISGSGSSPGLLCPMPEEWMYRSMPPRSAMSSSSSSGASGRFTSMVFTCRPGYVVCSACSSSVRRPAIPTVQPFAMYSLASSSPRPEVAPMMMTFFMRFVFVGKGKAFPGSPREFKYI